MTARKPIIIEISDRLGPNKAALLVSAVYAGASAFADYYFENGTDDAIGPEECIAAAALFLDCQLEAVRLMQRGRYDG